MTIIELIDIAKARIVYLSQQRTSAFQVGDEQQIARIDAEAAATQDTLNKLMTLV